MKIENDTPKKTSLAFKIVVGVIKLFYPKTKFLGVENIPDNPSIIVGNHAKTHGPIISQLNYPVNRYIWCAGEMLSSKEIPNYAYKDFWGNKPKSVKWIYRILSYLIAPLSFLFKNAYTIPVYRNARILDTFRQTIKRLQEGNHVIIFPETHVAYNNFVNEFEQNFVDVAKVYYKKTGEILSFTPAYYAPKLKTVIYGVPTKFNPNNNIESERTRICNYLKQEITSLALSLPRHKVVPYENVKKSKYEYSK